MKRTKAMHYVPMPAACKLARIEERAAHEGFLAWFDGFGQTSAPWYDAHRKTESERGTK